MRRTASKMSRRRFRGHRIETLECRRLLTNVSWIGTVPGDWNDPTNWNDNGQIPGVNDDVTINAGAGVAVNIGVSTELAHTLVTSSPILITNGTTLAVEAGLTLQGGTSIIVGGSTPGTSLFLQGTQTVSGTGSISLGGTGTDGSLRVSGTVTLASTIVVSAQGTGGISFSTANDTLINSGQMVFSTAAFPMSGLVGGGNFLNNGVLETVGSGGILISQLSSFTLASTGTFAVFVGNSNMLSLQTAGNGAPAVTLGGTFEIFPDGTLTPTAGTQIQVASFSPASTGSFSLVSGLNQSSFAFTSSVTPTCISLTITGSGPRVVNSLVFAQEPVSSRVTGTLSPVIVDVLDSNQNLLTTDNSNVTLTLAGATLGGTTTVAAVNGVATFSDLTITSAGAYALVASDGTDTPAVSTGFRVSTPPQHIGALNTDFGVNGLAGHSIGFATTDGIAQDGSQSILIGTIGASPNESFGVTRYNADGSIDTAFGSGGVVTTSFNGTDDVPSTVLILPGGRILVGGTATTFASGTSAGSEFAIAEYNSDGSPYAGFGAGTGQVLLSLSATPGVLGNDILKALVTNAAGIIYAGGSSNGDFAIAALNADGTPATGFGTGGHTLLDFAGGDDVINGLAVQRNGSIVAAGSTTSGGATSVALARFLPTCVLDKHFGTKGTVVTNVRGVFDQASSVAIQPKGQIVIGGLSATGAPGSLNTDFLLARYNSAGKLDRTFAGGTVITSFGQASGVTQLLIQGNGQIIASGKTAASLTNVVTNQLDVAVARYTITGALDPSFNTTGKAIISLNDSGTVTFNSQVSPADLIVASTLGDQFDQFVQSNQGIVSMTPGGELLDAGNSGSDTVEAEIVTAGVDLTATLLTAPPASVLGGLKGTASVKIAESGTSQATGTVTINLQVTTDAAGNGATTLKTVSERINLRQQQSHTYKVAFAFPSGLAAGDYYLFAVVDNGTTPSLQDLNQDNNLAPSSSTVNISPPFISLVGSGLTGAPFLTGKNAKVTFTLQNQGNVLAKGTISVELLLSVDQTTADGSPLTVKPVAVGLAAGKSKVVKLSALLPTVVPGTYYLIAVIDQADSLGSIDQTSSTVVDPVAIVITH